ncbi:MAG: 30S ribosomal protein S2 [Candidatus Paceibacteria bacterium]
MKAKETEKKDNLKTTAGNIDRLFAVGAHFGYSRSRRHPSVKPYIFGAKNWVEIIDLEKTNELLESATSFAKKLGEEGKNILFVGSKDEAKQAVEEGARALEMPYVTGRWIGGTITNFSQIKKRIERMKDLIGKRDKGEFDKKYTKKEQLMLDREIENLKTNFWGIGSMTEIPHAFFIIDTKNEDIAVKEAKQKGIPVIGLLNSDSNLTEIDYPIVANDATRASIKFFVDEIVEAYKEGIKSKK